LHDDSFDNQTHIGMTIYGLGLLAGCFIIGQLLGEWLGRLLHIDANVGGVGFAMLLFILLKEWLSRKHFNLSTSIQGVAFWDAMYIPIIVAMSATQNVKVLVGIIPVLCLILLVPVLSKAIKHKSTDHD
jgi:malonate transporter MadL subunit